MIRVSSSLYRGAILTAMLALAFVAGCKKKAASSTADAATATTCGNSPDCLAAGQPHLR